MLKKLAVFGKPIAHSKSPLIHSAAYKLLGLDWEYSRIECGESEFQSKVAALGPEWLGLSVTMPLKTEAYKLSTKQDEWASLSGAVNTLLRIDDGWEGYNTDVPGLARAMEFEKVDLQNTVILGTGSTAISAILAAKLRGAERITVLGRNLDVANDLVARFNSPETSVFANHYENPVSTEPTAVISTLPGEVGKNLQFHKELFQAHLFDVAYDPWPSPLTSRWNEHGGNVSSGIGMLIQQAVLQIRIFLHKNPTIPLPNENDIVTAMQKAAGFGQ